MLAGKSQPFRTRPMVDVIVGDPRILRVGHIFILVLRLGIEGDYIPGMQQSRDVAQDAK